jgi:hypothetical protein
MLSERSEVSRPCAKPQRASNAFVVLSELLGLASVWFVVDGRVKRKAVLGVRC